MPTAITSPRGQRLAGYLPGYYATSVVQSGLYQAGGAEADALRAAVAGVLDQFFGATIGFDLARLEADLGLPTKPGLDDAGRRSRVIAKLRGAGVATVTMVEQLALSFPFGAVDVVEDQPAYAVAIQFVDVLGVPPDLTSFQNALRRVVPANLTLSFAFRYETWDQLDAAALTWDQVDALGLTWDQFDTHVW